ncbi:hypothetical protein XGA_0051 [Xanthomonas hortorum ATCC 19865]|nr:hypothetical protein XGA_0051 [Xanthomonas hortorum ATCC 19865]
MVPVMTMATSGRGLAVQIPEADLKVAVGAGAAARKYGQYSLFD